ncbi:FadR/GntR family transcriptional regulator [Kitasatospora sp. NPDC057542]|uniref:FadR/GntR family transcriptional regulator n=1 Tax=Streptomycetaceae TaxID=2062 RepID=UPI001CCCABF8|nr:FCD domain-containing protein [Streptomyces sp. LS1784]
MTVRPVRHRSLVEEATAELRRLIGTGEWPVGSKLPGEVELSRLLGVGRTTSREAVRVLIVDGQLRARQGSGTYVAAASPVSEFDRELRRSEVFHVYEVRAALEVEAGRLAAQRRTETDVAALRAALAARDAAVSPAELVETDLELHRQVVRAARNPVLVRLFDSFVDALREAADHVVTDNHLHDGVGQESDARAHHALVEAIAAGDPDGAAAATQANLDRTLDRLRAAGAGPR